MDGPIGQELLDKITANANAGLVALCWMNSGARSLYNTKRPIKSAKVFGTSSETTRSVTAKANTASLKPSMRETS